MLSMDFIFPLWYQHIATSDWLCRIIKPFLIAMRFLIIAGIIYVTDSGQKKVCWWGVNCAKAATAVRRNKGIEQDQKEVNDHRIKLSDNLFPPPFCCFWLKNMKLENIQRSSNYNKVHSVWWFPQLENSFQYGGGWKEKENLYVILF